MRAVTLLATRRHLVAEWFAKLKRVFADCTIAREDPDTYQLDPESENPNRIHIEEHVRGKTSVAWMEVSEMDDDAVEQFEPEDLARFERVVPRPCYYLVEYRDLAQLSRALDSLSDEQIWVLDGTGLLLPIARFAELVRTDPDGYVDRFPKSLT